MLASELLSKAATTLNDTAGDRWTDAEKLGYLNTGLRELHVAIPAATQKFATHTATAGARQTVPADCHRIFDVPRNINADDTVGAAIWPMERRALDRHSPDWQSDTEVAAAEAYAYDPEEDADTFLLYPPVIAGTKVELSYSAKITALTDTGDTIPVGDEYEAALLDYVLARCYSKNSELAEASKAAGYFQSFYTSLGYNAHTAKKMAAVAAKVE